MSGVTIPIGISAVTFMDGILFLLSAVLDAIFMQPILFIFMTVLFLGAVLSLVFMLINTAKRM